MELGLDESCPQSASTCAASQPSPSTLQKGEAAKTHRVCSWQSSFSYGGALRVRVEIQLAHKTSNISCYSRLMKSENERFTLSNIPRASSCVRRKACLTRVLTLLITPSSSPLA